MMQIVGKCTNPLCKREFYTMPKDGIDHYYVAGADPKKRIVCGGKVEGVNRGRA